MREILSTMFRVSLVPLIPVKRSTIREKGVCTNMFVLINTVLPAVDISAATLNQSSGYCYVLPLLAFVVVWG